MLVVCLSQDFEEKTLYWDLCPSSIYEHLPPPSPVYEFHPHLCCPLPLNIPPNPVFDYILLFLPTFECVTIDCFSKLISSIGFLKWDVYSCKTSDQSVSKQTSWALLCFLLSTVLFYSLTTNIQIFLSRHGTFLPSKNYNSKLSAFL